MDSTIRADIEALVGPIDDRPADDLVTAEELAEWLGLSRRRIDELTIAKVLTRAARARYALRASILAYCADQRAKTSGRGRADPALTEERKRLVREQADREAIRNAVTRGELVAAADVKATWESILTDVRAAMLAVPSRLPDLDPATADRLDREIRAALEALANG